MTRAVVIDNLHGAAVLASEWQRVPAGGSSSIFTSPAWSVAAWRHLPDLGDPLLVVALDRADAVVGVLPLSVRSDGIGWAGSPLGDEHDVRLGAAAPADVIDVLLDRLAQEAGDRAFVLGDCKPDGQLAKVLRGVAGCPAPVLPLVTGEPEFGPLGRIPGWSRGRRRGLRNALQQLAALGEAIVEWTVDGDRLATVVPAFVTDRLDAWRQRGRFDELPIMDRHPSFPDFLADACQSLGREGRCLLARLMLDGTVIAQSLFFMTPAAYHWYMSTYREDMGRYGPSHLLLAQVADRAVGHGIPLIDLGRGDEPYKFDHGALPRRLVDFVFGT